VKTLNKDAAINKNQHAAEEENMSEMHVASDSHKIDDATAKTEEPSPINIQEQATNELSVDDEKSATKHYVMQITKCPHPNRKHYAKNMCSSCYRKFGRNDYARNCEHHDRLLYSKGMCQTCYLSDYH
jgi:hypothetical protein